MASHIVRWLAHSLLFAGLTALLFGVVGVAVGRRAEPSLTGIFVLALAFGSVMTGLVLLAAGGWIHWRFLVPRRRGAGRPVSVLGRWMDGFDHLLMVAGGAVFIIVAVLLWFHLLAEHTLVGAPYDEFARAIGPASLAILVGVGLRWGAARVERQRAGAT